MLPTEENNLVNLSNSFLKEMGAKQFNKSLKIVDEELEKKDYKNIILLLYDGMGSSILDGTLTKKSFLRTK